MIWGATLKPGEEFTEVVGNEVHLSMASLECRPRLAAGKDLDAHVIMKTSDGEYLLCTLGCYGPTPQQALDLILQPNERITFIVEGNGIVYLTGYTAGYTASEYGDNQETEFEGENDFHQVQEEDVYPPEEGQDVYTQEPENNEIMSDNADITVKCETRPDQVGNLERDDPFIEEMGEILQENEPNSMIGQIQQDDAGLNTRESWDINTATNQAAPTASQNSQNCCYCSKPTTAVKNFYDGPNLAVVIRPCCPNCSAALETTPRVGDPEHTSHPYQNHLQEQSVSHVTGNLDVSGHRGGPSKPTPSNLPQSVQHQVNHKRERHRTSQTKSNSRFDKNRFNNQPHRSQDLRPQPPMGVLMYRCTYCPKLLSSVSSRKIHERMHTGEKPYKCAYCPKAFTQSTNWKSHEKTHTGEKPYQCSYCEKTFIRTDAMKNHERTHTGEKPFKCMHCQIAFSQRSLLKKHQKSCYHS